MLQGDVNNLPLPALLQGLVSNHNSGILLLEAENRCRRIGVAAGAVELICDPDGNSEPLGQILTALEILQPEEISNILTNLGTSALGDALLRLRLLDTSMVTGPIRTLIHEQLLDLFRWQEARYRFEVCSWQKKRLFTGEGVSPCLRFTIPSLLLEVARREDEDHLNEAAGACLDEIYEIATDRQSAEVIIVENLAVDPIDKKFARLLQQPLPLKDVIDISGAPRSPALDTIRLLLEQSIIKPMSSREKKAVVKRLLSQQRPARAMAVLRSLVCQEDDLPALEQLLTLLRQEKAPVGEREQLLRRLASARNDSGDNIGCRKALRQRAELVPENLEAQLELLESLPLKNSRRETERLLERIFHCPKTASEALLGAEAIESRRAGDPIRDPGWLERSVSLRIQGNDPQGATRVLESLLREGLRAGTDLNSLHRWMELLEQSDAGAHQQWKAQLQRRRRASSSRVGVLVLLCIAFGLFAFLHGRNSPEQASALATSTISTQIEVPALLKIISSDENGAPEATHLIALERGFSRAIGLRTDGEYLKALKQMRSLRNTRLPATSLGAIDKFCGELEDYLENAQKLLERSLGFKEQGNQEGSLSLQLQLVREYPHSPIVKRMKLELPLELTPRHATISIDGKIVPSHKHGDSAASILLPADHPILISAQRPGYQPQMMWHEPGSLTRIQFHLSRLPEGVVGGDTAIETTISTAGTAVIVIDRDSQLRSISPATKEVHWKVTARPSGDLVDGALLLEDSILVATTTGHLLLIDTENGSVIRETKISTGPGILRNTPIAVADKIVVATSRGIIHALDRKSLEVIWTREMELIRRSPLQTSDGLLIAVGPISLSGIDVADGSTLWQRQTPHRGLATTARRSALFVATTSEVTRYSAQDGKPIWSLALDADPHQTLKTTSDLLLLLSENGSLRAINLDQGTIRWSTPRTETKPLVSTIGGNLFAFSDADAGVRVIDLRNGQLLWTHRGSSRATSIAFDGKRLLVGDESGDLLLFDLETDEGDLSAAENSS
jgi:outer membrane protein assembly factor BamB